MNKLQKLAIVGVSLPLAMFVASCAGVDSNEVLTETGESDLQKAPPGTLVIVEDPNAGDAGAGGATTNDANCGGIFNPCGILNNRTDRWLEVSRDSSSSFSCQPTGPYGWVAPGRNSNQSPPGFKDTDCFRSNECSVFYTGILHPPGDWVRIRTSVFIYSLGC